MVERFSTKIKSLAKLHFTLVIVEFILLRNAAFIASLQVMYELPTYNRSSCFVKENLIPFRKYFQRLVDQNSLIIVTTPLLVLLLRNNIFFQWNTNFVDASSPGSIRGPALFDSSVIIARRFLAVFAVILYPAATFALQPGKDESKSNTKLPSRNSSNSQLSPRPAEAGSESEPVLSDQERESSIQNLRRRNLLFPIEGVDPSTIKGSFYEMHGGAMHGASDILAPRNTPIHALEDGTIAQLFLSKPGGLTIYQFDPSGEYVYYYAHLEKYAPGLTQGDKVKRGQVIGYVGTSGNAPKDTPHLHLSVSLLGPEKHWWVGAPIDPYDVFNK